MILAELQALTDGEIDRLVHEKVMGIIWPSDRCGNCGFRFARSQEAYLGLCTPSKCEMDSPRKPRADADFPAYATDLNVCRVAEEKYCSSETDAIERLGHKIRAVMGDRQAWTFRATARERCMAMVMVVKGL